MANLDPTVDALLRGLEQGLQSTLDAFPDAARIEVSRLWLEQWRDTVSGARLLLQVQPGSRVEWAIGLGLGGFLAGLALGWSTH